MTDQADIHAGLKSTDRVPLALGVGIVGHRPGRLPKDAESLSDLQQCLDDILEQVASTLLTFTSQVGSAKSADASPILTAVTPLAEGSDRMFARAALNNGYRLFCPLPFAIDEYKKDFPTEDSRAEFQFYRDAAEKDGSVFCLDGRRPGDGIGTGSPYGAAGRIVVDRSDLLVAVWDGNRAADKAGGTYETMVLALQSHLPVLWLSTEKPFAWRILTSASDFNALTAHGPVPWQDTDQYTSNALKRAVDTLVRHEIELPDGRLEPLPG